MYNKVAVVIPSYKPDEKLISTVRGIREAGFSDLIVVDDGGGEKYAEYFRRVREEFGATVLTHEVNRGKGAALKTAFAYYSKNRPDSIGLVTADADGQHLPEDIASVAEQMVSSNSVVLGCRDFSAPHVPPRSKFGNRTTSAIFKIFFGMKISDTQTGLRAIPKSYVDTLAEASGDRYEYETHMLFLMKQKDIPFTEVKIKTVYIEENKSSHFRVIHDSVRIYDLMLRYAGSSIVCSLLDLGFFFVFYDLLVNVDLPLISGETEAICAFFLGALLGRLASAVFNYLLNAAFVFRGKISFGTFGKYCLLAVPRAIISALICVLSPIYALRILFDLALFPISFKVQHNKIFK